MQNAGVERLQWLKFLLGLMIICGALHAFQVITEDYRIWLRLLGGGLSLIFFWNVLDLIRSAGGSAESSR